MSTKTTYQDAFAVVAGLERTANDLHELANECHTTAKDVRRAVQSGKVNAEALDNLHKQFAWLTSDVERMRAALRREEPPHAS